MKQQISIDETMNKARRHRANIRELNGQMTAQAESNSVGLGELVHVVTDWLGIAQCAPCVRRQMKFDKIKIPDKLLWGELVNRAKQLREPDEIQVTWVNGD